MADKLTPEQRHRCMASIRSKDTKPEMLVRRYLFARGFRYRVNVKRLPGTPDIVLRKYRTVIFINGCFWHGHEDCPYFVLPKTNTPFWKAKIERKIFKFHYLCLIYLADKSYVCKELMQAGAGSEEGAAGSPPLQKKFWFFPERTYITLSLIWRFFDSTSFRSE